MKGREEIASRGKELLTADQRAEFVRIPADMTERELETYYTFFNMTWRLLKDIEEIIIVWDLLFNYVY